MKVLLLVLQYLPAIIELMKKAEELWPNAGDGTKFRLPWIIDILEAVVGGLGSLEPVVKKIISNTATSLSASGKLGTPKE